MGIFGGKNHGVGPDVLNENANDYRTSSRCQAVTAAILAVSDRIATIPRGADRPASFFP
ncbi:hypothetical protein Acaty_c1311 [Acidithiobacillus caldus ATCC 51756]|uniref:Uncharacterized protein n=1 Tax=Acidithiobacillus caldus (strain ATCC 51756 / DSM 8584 / KU) TaxID=637389 RepID=A0A059ZQL1_ACICK|nr:hypothetical protein Acaty_c1311 [Acidithiobacillus caldus ATCC 51756]